jgi:hypothetical protein
MPMDKISYLIQMRSIDECLAHLRTIHLTDLYDAALHHGNPAERARIAAVRTFLQTLP